MTQSRLNSIAVCHVHQNLLDETDVSGLVKDFARRSDVRQKLFGRW